MPKTDWLLNTNIWLPVQLGCKSLVCWCSLKIIWLNMVVTESCALLKCVVRWEWTRWKDVYDTLLSLLLFEFLCIFLIALILCNLGYNFDDLSFLRRVAAYYVSWLIEIFKCIWGDPLTSQSNHLALTDHDLTHFPVPIYYSYLVHYLIHITYIAPQLWNDPS